MIYLPAEINKCYINTINLKVMMSLNKNGIDVIYKIDYFAGE